jgi:hypothetical protein
MLQVFDCKVWVQDPLPLQRSFVHQTPSDVQAVVLDAFDHADVLLADWQS